MAAKRVRARRLIVEFKSQPDSDVIRCEVSGVVGTEAGVERMEPIAEVTDESPDLIVLWGPLDGDGWQINGRELIRCLQQAFEAMNERPGGSANPSEGSDGQ